MKQIAIGKLLMNPKCFLSVLWFLAIILFSAHVNAAQSIDAVKNSPEITRQSTRDFNHALTGFPLTGLHVAAECASCHIGGIFKGTPRNCSGCHAKGKRVVATAMSSKHIPTTEQCEVCHSSTVTFLGAHFNHGSVAPNDCKNCHNGVMATGKPTSHNSGIKASAKIACGSCHRSIAWLPAFMNHSDIVVNPCSSCHGGNYADVMGKTANHIPTASIACETCHTSTVTPGGFATWRMSHSSVATTSCSTCHTGMYPNGKGKSVAHFPTTAPCENCHKSTIAWTPATMDHAGLSTNCASCHSGSYKNVVGKSVNHIPTVATPCEVCHTSTVTPGGFVTWKMNHAPFPTNCATCHTGTYPNGKGKSAAHFPTTTPCENCHKSTSAWTPAAMDHTGIAGSCASCHSGSYTNIVGKSANHIPTSATPCEICHTSTVTPGGFVTWKMNHTPFPTNCATCHTGTYPNGKGKPASHNSPPKGTLPCENCHKSTSAWLPAGMDHTGIATNCASCHDGAQAMGKTSNHIPTTTTPCETCHTSTVTPGGFATWRMNHTSVATTSCATCHTGTYPNGRGKPLPSHATGSKATGACSLCHKSTSAWLPAGMDHTGISTGCASCHDGVQATGKTANHIPTGTIACEICHTSTVVPGGFATWRMNHTSVAATSCATCHSGSYPNGRGKPASHSSGVKATGACSACHKSTTAWLPAGMDHTGITTGCASCHDGVQATGKTANHIPTGTIACEICHTSTVVPGGFATWRMNHTSVAATSCATCHSGSYPNGRGKPASHSSGPKATGACNTCHIKGGTSSWLPAGFDHSTVTRGTCATCHNGSSATGKTASHTGSKATLSCDNCHSTTAWLPASFSHSGVAPGTCATCHAAQRPASHASRGYTGSCDQCHPIASSWVFNHAAQQGKHTCNSCHRHHNNTTPCDQCHTVYSWDR